MVMVGAEGVVENGGVINKLGTYQIAICARAHNVPVYVAAESYKVRAFEGCGIGHCPTAAACDLRPSQRRQPTRAAFLGLAF